MTGDRHPPLLVAWALVVAVGLGWGLGSYPLVDQDEGRNGEVAREMAASNDYVLPHLNGLPYVDKPILFFAGAAVAMEIMGPTELAARIVPFLCALATALLVMGPEPAWALAKRLGLAVRLVARADDGSYTAATTAAFEALVWAGPEE